jgi:hypothetical protein
MLKPTALRAASRGYNNTAAAYANKKKLGNRLDFVKKRTAVHIQIKSNEVFKSTSP